LKRRGFTIYAGQGQLQERIFRIATMGEITEGDMQNLMTALEVVFK
jgi:2-aminoethylphosphonate-pyruvate transaminase